MVEESGARFEKYFDETYKTPYFFDKTTGESLWELPEGVDEATEVIDRSVPEPVAPEEKKDDQAAAEGDELLKYKAHMNSVD